MSDRFYTTIKVSGPDADAAAKSALDTFRNLPIDADGWDSYQGSWCDDDVYFGPCYFSRNDEGEPAILIVTEVSRNFPDATFLLTVHGEGAQVLVTIRKGRVQRDGDTDEPDGIRVQLSPEERANNPEIQKSLAGQKAAGLERQKEFERWQALTPEEREAEIKRDEKMIVELFGKSTDDTILTIEEGRLVERNIGAMKQLKDLGLE